MTEKTPDQSPILTEVRNNLAKKRRAKEPRHEDGYYHVELTADDLRAARLEPNGVLLQEIEGVGPVFLGCALKVAPCEAAKSDFVVTGHDISKGEDTTVEVEGVFDVDGRLTISKMETVDGPVRRTAEEEAAFRIQQRVLKRIGVESNSSAPLTGWTKDFPTKPGWYWLRRDYDDKGRGVWVTESVKLDQDGLWAHSSARGLCGRDDLPRTRVMWCRAVQPPAPPKMPPP